eukprot:jgi/Mesvir1/14332/Mv09742-RA.2
MLTTRRVLLKLLVCLLLHPHYVTNVTGDRGEKATVSPLHKRDHSKESTPFGSTGPEHVRKLLGLGRAANRRPRFARHFGGSRERESFRRASLGDPAQCREDLLSKLRKQQARPLLPPDSHTLEGHGVRSGHPHESDGDGPCALPPIQPSMQSLSVTRAQLMDVVGLWHHGSNWLCRLLAHNDNGRGCLLGTRVPGTCSTSELGWKHGYMEADVVTRGLAGDGTPGHMLHVVVYRNPYSWLLSLYQRQHEFGVQRRQQQQAGGGAQGRDAGGDEGGEGRGDGAGNGGGDNGNRGQTFDQFVRTTTGRLPIVGETWCRSPYLRAVADHYCGRVRQIFVPPGCVAPPDSMRVLRAKGGQGGGPGAQVSDASIARHKYDMAMRRNAGGADASGMCTFANVTVAECAPSDVEHVNRINCATMSFDANLMVHRTWKLRSYEGLRLLHTRVYRVRYEDMLADPASIIRDMATRFSLTVSDQCESLLQEGNAQQQAALHKESSGAYMSAYSKELRQFVASRLNAQVESALGYDIETGLTFW